jgi:hypothetical protein
LYRAACAACHGIDGRGAPPSLTGFDIPLPDLTDCAFTTPERTADWMAVAHEGGPGRGFDRRMPAFGQALSESDLRLVLDHIRGFCPDRRWPRGELNLPRPFVTEKAFPENEAVLTTSVAASGPGSVSNELVYEHRIGPRGQFEVSVPLEAAEAESGGWRRGLGDLGLAYKHALHHTLDGGRIFSLGAEVVFPTGKEAEGLGKGVTVFEPFAAFGQILPAGAFFHAHAGFELPANRDRAANEAFLRMAVGKSVVPAAYGRMWTPMVELVGARELVGGEPATWDILPQMQVTLSRRQHIMMNIGVRVPINEREGRSTSVLAYLLWDWFDGGFFDGWR